MDDIGAETRQICEQRALLKGPLLPILNDVQDRFGHVPAEAVGVIAKQLNLSRAEVHGVVSFYHLYRTRPAGEKIIYMCCSEACQSMQGNALLEHAKSSLGIGMHETTPDGRYSLEPIYCLGNCACAPALMIDTTLHGRVSTASFDALLETRD
jgi:formate dehydrogenase subunit gamma